VIKKAIAFVVLVAGGFAAVYWITAGDLVRPARSASTQPAPAPAPKRSEPQGDGFVVELGTHREHVGSEITINYEGPFHLEFTREVVLPDGALRNQLLYILDSANSRLLRDGRQELEDVNVTFFEAPRDPRAETQVEAGRLHARRAYLQVGVDEKGRSSVAKDKDIDLLDAVLESGASEAAKGLRLNIDHARVRATDDGAHVATPDEQAPIRAELQGSERPAVLTGRGLVAWFPLRQEQRAEADARPASIEVLHDPQIVLEGPQGENRISGRGPLRYTEDARTGRAEIALEGDVEIHGDLSAGGSSESAPVRAFGDRLRARLSRTKGTGTAPSMRWSAVRLTGAPAGLRGQGIDLSCEAIDVTPNADGEPWLFTARGRPRLVSQAEEQPMQFTAADRIHLVRTPAYLRPWLQGRGWSATASTPQLTELLVFCGATSLTLPQEGKTMVIEAPDGLRVLRTAEPDGPIAVFGAGPVALASENAASPMKLDGTGFLLFADARGQHLRLGPRTASAAHRFAVTTGDLTVTGSGSCRLSQPAAKGAPGSIAIDSPAADLELTMRGTGGSLRHAAALTAQFTAGGAPGAGAAAGLLAFDARGPKCELAWSGEGQSFRGHAARISGDASTYRLHGAPAEIVSEQGTFRGEEIRIVQLGKQHTLVQASGSAHVIVDRLPDADPNAPRAGLDLRADRIDLVPFAAPRVRWSLARGEPLLPGSLSARHLIARGNVVAMQLAADREPVSRAAGESLVLALGDDPAGRLLGAPALLTTDDGQRMTARAPEILLTGKAGTVQLRPGDDVVTLELSNRRGRFADFGSPGGSTRVECRGVVDADQHRVDFLGPVETVGLREDGSPDPAGLRLNARSMYMVRDADGQPERVHAEGGTELAWRGMEVIASDLDLDLVKHLCTVIDRDLRARVSMPGTFKGRCSRAELNYLTYESVIWNGQVAGDRSRR
jgi:hypothetical protein